MAIFLNALFGAIGLSLLILGLNTGNKHALVWSFMVPMFGYFLTILPPRGGWMVLVVFAILGTFVWEGYLLDASDLKISAGLIWGVYGLVVLASALGRVVVWIKKRSDNAGADKPKDSTSG